MSMVENHKNKDKIEGNDLKRENVVAVNMIREEEKGK